MSRMLKFRSAPDYESPMGGANDDSNTYMVTVKAGRRRNGDAGKSPSKSPTWTNSVR